MKYFYKSVSAIRSIALNKKLNFSTGKNIKICVIDSGWNKNLYDLRITKGIGLADRNNEFELKLSDDFDDRIGHGTAVIDLILQIASDASIFPVRVFNKSLETSSIILIESIKWAIENDMDIINLSLGTILEEHLIPLYKICESARSNNIIIVASKNNNNEWSYPAIFENTIGVTTGKFSNPFEYTYNAEDAIEIIAKGTDQFAMWRDKRCNLIGNSFATPNITGIVALLLEKYPRLNLEEARALLKEFSR